jgi:SAM-dependent methyltransferase
MAEYDDFAWFYHRYWNEEFHGLAFPILERIWLARVPAGVRILDVCCGTGYLAALLADRGYSVTGVDASAEMIRYARATAPTAEFHIADAAAFQLPQVFGGAVSTFDSLNHLLTLEALQAAFRNTAAALQPGALFAFDMLMDEAYRTHWGDSFALVRDDHALTITGSHYDARHQAARCNVTMFRLLDGQWRRADVTVQERCYTPAEIGRALEQAGFGEVFCYDADDLGMGGELGEGRAFFVTSKL